MSESAEPTPERILGKINAHRSSAAIKGAIELGLFTALGGASRSAAWLAEEIGAAERGVRILCDFLTIDGLMEKRGSEYRAAADAARFLDERSPAYFGSVAKFMLGPELVEAFWQTAAAARKGGTLMEGQGTVEPDNPLWVEFARNMAPLMAPAAEHVAEVATRGVAEDAPLRVLDVAAGHGMFGIAIARRRPRARVVAVDWPAVLDVATANAEEAGVADRHERLEGDAFEVDFGAGYDVVLLTNFLHHYDAATCTELLRKAHRALAEGGCAVTLEFVPNEDRVTPPEEAAFALTMLVSTTSGDAYTFRELERMAADAGFAASELVRLDDSPQSIVISKR